MAEPDSFEDYVSQLTALGGVGVVDPATRLMIETAAEALASAAVIDRSTLAAMIAANPEWVRVLGLSVGLSQENLRGVLNDGFGTSGWVTLARTRSTELVAHLDDTLDLVAKIETQRARDWTFADVLIERQGSRSRAGGAIDRGRALEDLVEAVVLTLGLPHVMRTTFGSRARATAPCDLAIPAGGAAAQIVVGIKGFDSTGSKLSDAVREVQQSADVRLPRQYVFAVVDGAGWRRRRRDLRRIYDLWANRSIDGLYTVATLDDFRADVEHAADRLGIGRTA